MRSDLKRFAQQGLRKLFRRAEGEARKKLFGRSGETKPKRRRRKKKLKGAVPGNGASDIEMNPSIVISYDPMMDGDPDTGEVVWTWVPYEEDPNQGKDRPVVIFGRHGDRLAGVMLTSKDYDRDDHVSVGSGGWDSKGRESFAKLERILDIDPDAVRREGSILAEGRFNDLVAALRRHHGVVLSGR